MPKRSSIEDRIVEYFQTAPLAETQIVLNVVRGTVARRTAGVAPATISKTAPTKKKPGRKPRSVAPSMNAGDGPPAWVGPSAQ